MGHAICQIIEATAVSEDVLMEAIVLAGGLGTRLRGVVDDVPKPMAPVQGRPFLAFVLDQLVDGGFRTAILAAGYRHEAIRSHFGEKFRTLAACLLGGDRAPGHGRSDTLGLRSGRCARRVRVERRYLPGAGLPRHAGRARAREVAIQHGGLPRARCRALWRARAVRRHRARLSRKRTLRARLDQRRDLHARPRAARSHWPQARVFFEQDLLVPEVGSIRPSRFPRRGGSSISAFPRMTRGCRNCFLGARATSPAR